MVKIILLNLSLLQMNHTTNRKMSFLYSILLIFPRILHFEIKVVRALFGKNPYRYDGL